MLEREVGRLQALCRLQGQEQQLKMQHQQQQPQINPKHRRTKSKDAIISSSRSPINGQLQI